MPVKPAPYVNRSCKPAPPLPVKKYRQSLNYQSSIACGSAKSKTISGPPKKIAYGSAKSTSKQSLKSSIMSTLRRSFWGANIERFFFSLKVASDLKLWSSKPEGLLDTSRQKSAEIVELWFRVRLSRKKIDLYRVLWKELYLAGWGKFFSTFRRGFYVS